MKKSAKHFLEVIPKPNGYILYFQAKLNMDGRFECHIFSDGERVVIITGEGVRSQKKGSSAKILYKYHCCRVGDDEYLRKLFESEVLLKNPSLLSGEHYDLFSRIIDKIRSYGIERPNLKDCGYVANQRPSTPKVSYLSDYRRISCRGNGHRLRRTNLYRFPI